jgi:hypothetical protein
LDAIIFHQPKTNWWNYFKRSKTDNIAFGESCSRPWASRRNTNLLGLSVCSEPTRKSFCAREKLFRVGIRKEEEEFYSDQIHAALDQSFCAVHPSTENHIQKKLSAVPTRGHTGASSGEGMSTA